MKNAPILFLILLLTGFLSCKKDNVPPTDEETVQAGTPDSSGKDATVTTVITTGETLTAPAGIAADTCGCIIITEPAEHRIKDIDENGMIKILAGSGQQGAADGPGAQASFNYPLGIVKDRLGNLYITDSGNHKIRKVTPKGMVSTFAGSGQRGAADGPAAEASFSYPTGIAIDSDNNLYLADGTNYKIRKITASGQVSTIAGTGVKGSKDGPVATATFGEIRGLAIDAEKNLYIAESSAIRKISIDGQVSTFAGSNSSGMVNAPGTNARFSVLQGLAIGADGKLYVADFGNSRIRVITPSGFVSTFAGNGDQKTLDGLGWESSFKTPFGIAIDENGDIFVSDPSEGKIRKISPKK